MLSLTYLLQLYVRLCLVVPALNALLPRLEPRHLCSIHLFQLLLQRLDASVSHRSLAATPADLKPSAYNLRTEKPLTADAYCL